MDRVSIPSDLNEEDVFFSAGPVKLSIRQLVIIAAGMMLWYIAAKFFLASLFGINLFFAMIACGWIPLIGFAFAFMKIGHRPLDVWIGEKLAFIIGARTYVMRDPESRRGVEADLEYDEDLQAMLEHRRNS